MLKSQKIFIDRFLPILLLTILFLLLSLTATGQELTNSQATFAEVASKNSPADMKHLSQTAMPVYKDFMGVALGMEAAEVRKKLGHLKNKGERQDLFVFSESQSAQIGYDEQGKVIVISVDYFSKEDETPSPEAVLGEAVQTKPDGSIYHLKRYPAAGYWVAYSRTAGDNPMVTVTMKKI